MSREQLAKDNGMTIEFVNWFFENKKDGCGNVWFMMMAAMWEGYQAATASMQSERDQLAAECAALNERMQKLIQIINNADNNYCMCGEAMEIHGHGGCGHPTGMFDYHYNAWLEADNKIPATDRFLAEQRAQGVEMFAKHIALYNSNSEAHAKDFAAQLRNEVKV